MIKNERLVHAMTPEQRIKTITGVEFYKNRSLDGYAFPVFDICENPLASKNVRLTSFPSDAALACAWNSALVERVYKCAGNEAKAAVANAYYNITNLTCDESASSEEFAVGKLLSGKIAGLNRSGAFVNFEDKLRSDLSAEEMVAGKLISDAVFGAGEPDSVICSHSEKINSYAEYRFNGLKYGIAETKEQVAAFLTEGYSFVFLKTDFTEELVPYLLELTVRYDKALDACKRGKISPEQLEECCKELKMLPMAAIDEACGRVIETLINLGNCNADSVVERKTALREGESAQFDERLHSDVALEAARESVVLIKNDGILPLRHELRVAVLGEYAKSAQYTDDGNLRTENGLPFEVINDYEIQTVGFAYGYRKGETGRQDLLKTAVKLAAGADVALAFLCADKGETALPAEQIELIDALKGRGVKIIAVLDAENVTDLSFAEKCCAVLFSARGGQKLANAVFEIITGLVNPSGKLSRPIAEDEKIRYPLGYGLSYTKFAYSKLSVTERGVALTVSNVGEYDGYAVVTMRIGKKNKEKGSEEPTRLRGFKKVFVKKNDTAKIEIPFGEETFRTYDSEKKKYRNEGGEYTVRIYDGSPNGVLDGELTLAPYVYDDEKERSARKSEYADGERAVKEFASPNEKAFYTRRKFGGFGLKLALALMLAVYCDAATILLIVGGLINGAFGYACVGVVAAAVNVGVIAFCIALAKKRNALTNSPVYIGDVVEKLGTFKELATVSYEKPLSSEETELAQEENASADEEKKVEETPVYEYDTGFTELRQEDIKFRENASFAELCTNFHEYAMSYGVDVEASSARSLFASLAASKLVLLDVKNKEVLPLFTQALCGYFGGVQAVEAGWAWSKPENLYWTLENGKYVASGFVNAMYSAVGNPDKNALAVISRVQPETLKDYFGDIIKYALFPSEEHILKLNDETQLTLPHNIRYVLITENGFGELSPELAAASVQAELLISKAEPSAAVEVKSVSYAAFEELVKEAREEHFMKEVVWKKIDDLTEAINASERFALGNKSVLQTERLTSVLLACGADDGETFSAAFTNKIVGLLKTLKLYKRDGGERVLFGMLEKLFGDENLSKIQKALIKTASANSTGGV